VRPTLLGVVTLLFLLLFFLLSTSSGQRLGAVALRFSDAADLAPLPHAGVLQRLVVQLGPDGAAVLAEVSTTDIAASSSSVERRRIEIGRGPDGRLDLAALSAAVEQLHALDRAQERAEVVPADGTPTQELFDVLDVVRGPRAAPLFMKVALGGVSG
jgi:hypothetical protein